MAAWFLKPKNAALCILTLLIISIGGLYLWQRNTVTRQAAEVKQLTLSNDSLRSEIVAYKANLEAAKKVQEAHQVINNHTQTIREQIKYIQADCKLGEQDEKIINNITAYFNNGVRGTNGDPKTSGKVLPETGKAGPTGGDATKSVN